MKIVLMIKRGALLLSRRIVTRDEGAKRENLWNNNLKENDLSSESSNDRSTDGRRRPLPKGQSKTSKKRHWSRSKKNKKIQNRRYSPSPSPSSSYNSDSDESKYRNNESKERTDLRLTVVSEVDTKTAYLQLWPNTPTLILILISKRQTW